MLLLRGNLALAFLLFFGLPFSFALALDCLLLLLPGFLAAALGITAAAFGWQTHRYSNSLNLQAALAGVSLI